MNIDYQSYIQLLDDDMLFDECYKQMHAKLKRIVIDPWKLDCCADECGNRGKDHIYDQALDKVMSEIV